MKSRLSPASKHNSRNTRVHEDASPCLLEIFRASSCTPGLGASAEAIAKGILRDHVVLQTRIERRCGVVSTQTSDFIWGTARQAAGHFMIAVSTAPAPNLQAPYHDQCLARFRDWIGHYRNSHVRTLAKAQSFHGLARSFSLSPTCPASTHNPLHEETVEPS